MAAHFGLLARLLTHLLKKDNFIWTPATAQAFVAPKQALSPTPVLALPNFSRPFTVECDASDADIGAVFPQD